ncbi:hypothetical protein ACIQZB_34115 [Streptomyces sp. NPDC097727]|uniref:hypothetical protein n=1 Tax=Streptomyces sp. NPDC097727 TaxID=3366092 RepID=UPI0038043A54
MTSSPIARRELLRYSAGGVAALPFALNAISGSTPAESPTPSQASQRSTPHRPRHYGVVYDVGLRFGPEGLSVEPFDEDLVRYDINSIANELHANAIRIEGEVIDRLVTATRIAHAAGLTVYFNPWRMNAGLDETRSYVAQAAQAAERLRREGVDIVFLVGCELTIFTDGIYPGASYAERGTWLAEQSRLAYTPPGSPEALKTLAEKVELLNETLRSYVAAVRRNFHGVVSYAAGLWEDVDWSPFDIVGLDAYRDSQTEKEYRAIFKRHRKHDKPIAAMEFGCCKYAGAGARGAGGFTVLQGANPDGTGIWTDGIVPTRDEAEQAQYIETQIDLMTDSKVDALFVFEFSKPALPTGEGAKDLDMASFAIVSTYPASDPRSQQMPPWKRTDGFQRVSEIFARFATETGSGR